MGTVTGGAAVAARVGAVLVVAWVSWVWGYEAGYWSGLDGGPPGFLGERDIDR